MNSAPVIGGIYNRRIYGNIHTLQNKSGVKVGARGDIIPNGESAAVAIENGSSVYDANGNVLWTNTTGTAQQIGQVINVVDAGGGQYMYQIDTSLGYTPLNIGTVFSSAYTPDSTEPNIQAYFAAQGYGNQTNTNGTGAGTTPGTGQGTTPGTGTQQPASSPTGTGAGTTPQTSPNGSTNPTGATGGGAGGLGWLSTPGFFGLNKFESGAISLLLIALGVVVVDNVSRSK
jgi:hypothetical protein